MTNRWIIIALLGWLLCSCRTSTAPLDSGSELLATGPASTRVAWIKSPESIEGTVTRTWGIPMTADERWTYIQSVYSTLGGTRVVAHGTQLENPNELYILALDNLSRWLARKLLTRQAQLEQSQDDFLFQGLGFEDDDVSCFADDAKEWCDFRDGVKIGSLTAASVDPAALTKEWRKRLMHNVQEIGEFLYVTTDNTVAAGGTGKHVPAWLIDDVFLKKLKAPVTMQQELLAWQEVVYTILMSGAFFLEIPADFT